MQLYSAFKLTAGLESPPDLEAVAYAEGSYHLVAQSPSEAEGIGLESPKGQLERTIYCPAARTPSPDSHTDVGHSDLEWIVTSSREL